MKGLDTPILVRLLRGDPAVRAVLRKLEGEELATTEWNLLELEVLASSDSSSGRERRKAALEKLRRRLTVLPLDQKAVEVLASPRQRGAFSGSLVLGAIAATLESRGCKEWYTDARTAAGWKTGVLRAIAVK